MDDVNTFERTLKVGVLVHLEGPPEAGYGKYCECGPMRTNLLQGAVFAWEKALEMKIFPTCRTVPPAGMAETAFLQAMEAFVCYPHSPTFSWSRVARCNHWVHLSRIGETSVVVVVRIMWSDLWVKLSRCSSD